MSRPASKETIERLKKNLELTIPQVYSNLKLLIATREAVSATGDELRSRLHSLMIVVDFIWLDVCVSCRAIFVTDDSYEKRFHYKNLLASISEGYKTLFGFGKSQRKSVWTEAKNLFDQLGDADVSNTTSSITEELKRFGKENIDKKARDIAYHYNVDMMEVYNKTVSLSDEEKVMNTVIRLLRILEKMSSLYKRVNGIPADTTADLNQYSANSASITVGIDLQYKVLQDSLDKDGRFSSMIREHLPSASHGIDTIVSTIRQAEHVRASLTGKLKSERDIRGITHTINLGKTMMLLHYMISDYGTIIDTYLHSTTVIECAMNMRRCVIIKTSVLEHLYVYTEDERARSMWTKISRCIPAEETELSEIYDSVGTILKKMTDHSTDNDLRALLVHPYDNSRQAERVQATMLAIECLLPFAQVREFEVMEKIYHVCNQFINKLQDVINRNISEENQRQQQEMLDRIAQIEQMIDNSNMTKEQKAESMESSRKLRELLETLNSLEAY